MLLDPAAGCGSAPRGRRFPFPVPERLVHRVPEADDLAAGEVRALHYFGRDLVLYRTRVGAPRVLDAHCPHLGAHLAVGGKVEGECLRCPFHGWRSTASPARASRSPTRRATRIPSKAHARSYPTIERNQMIWAWHHAEGASPFYDVPEVDEFDDPDWTDDRRAASSRSPSPARRWPRTTSTSPTSSSSTAPTPSPRTSSSSTAPTSAPSARTATSCARATASASACCASRTG